VPPKVQGPSKNRAKKRRKSRKEKNLTIPTVPPRNTLQITKGPGKNNHTGVWEMNSTGKVKKMTDSPLFVNRPKLHVTSEYSHSVENATATAGHKQKSPKGKRKRVEASAFVGKKLETLGPNIARQQ